ncbi:MAG TPA: TonB family protein [Herbaspirillum sp.]|nr:TonB family protein [Herbaspirillum sp.]
MNAIVSAQRSATPLGIWKQVKRIGPLGAIILLHIAFFYALESGLIKKAADTLPKEVFVSLIPPQHAPEPAPPKETPKPEETPKPKIAPIVKKSVAPPLPVLNIPSPTAVTAPPTPPQPAAPPEVTPATPATPAVPKTVTSGVEYIQKPQVEYPAASKRMSEEGTVILHVLVNEKGRAESVDIQKTSGSPRLDEAARQAARRALFKPYIEDGKAIRVYANVPITFKLDS